METGVGHRPRLMKRNENRVSLQYPNIGLELFGLTIRKESTVADVVMTTSLLLLVNYHLQLVDCVVLELLSPRQVTTYMCGIFYFP